MTETGQKQKLLLYENLLKDAVFQMWYRVEIRQFDSRSFIGDLALELRDSIYRDENRFWTEYDMWKARHVK